MRCCGGIQTNQGEVLDDCCHVTFVLRTFHAEGHVITPIFLLNKIKKIKYILKTQKIETIYLKLV